MDWIKKNYDRFALIVAAVALLVSSIFLILTARGFSDRFAPVLTDPPHGKKVVSLETEAMEKANTILQTPPEWKAHNGSLFVSRKYVGKTDPITKRDSLIDPFEPGSPALHAPVPNDWFLQNGLADRILDNDVLDQDPDKDGFTNLDEFNGQTNPVDPASHPAYITKLRLKQFVKKSSRLKFEAYDDDGNFQINTVDVKQPSQFVKIGDTIQGTKYKVISFEKKSVLNERTGVDEDVSTLTVENTETHLRLVMTVRHQADSPDLYARFAYLWDSTEVIVKKDGTFTLKPEADIQYKLIDIGDAEALIINVKTGDQIKVPRLE